VTEKGIKDSRRVGAKRKDMREVRNALFLAGK
jgi:hypothetical protein